MLENKSTLKGKKPNKQKIWEAISMKFDGRDGKQTEECWKNLRKRVIEKKRIIDESANRTGGGVASNVTRLSPLEERILSIIKFAVPILGVDDSNSVSTEASSLSHQIDSENSKSLKPPMPKRNFTREFSEQITPQEQMVMNQKNVLDIEAKWNTHLYALKCYKECIFISQAGVVPSELVKIAQKHLSMVITSGEEIYGNEPVVEDANIQLDDTFVNDEM